MNGLFFGLALAGITSLCANPAWADCAPLRMINTVKMESVGDGERLLVPVIINGTPEKLILDTGGATTQLSPGVVKELGLRLEQSHIALFDLYGNASNNQVTVKTFELGRQKGQNFVLQVSASPEFGSGAAGLFSSDFFLAYDVDLDFGAGRMNFFSQDHCAGRVTYWPERPLSVVKFTLEGADINVPVTVDGHALTAVLDTGAPRTVMTTTVASDVFGLIPGNADTPMTGASDTESGIKYYVHKFAGLSFEGLTVANPGITIMTDRMGAGPGVFKSSIRGVLNDPYNHVQADRLIIGMDVLSRLHVYIAYREKKLYITPAGSGESVLFKDAPSP
jgi:hypothetical protein